MATSKKTKIKYVYVLTQEHYHFPPNDSDMVAATPLKVSDGSYAGLTYLRITATRYAKAHCDKAGIGKVKEYSYGDKSTGECYRVWVDFPEGTHKVNAFADKFVWAVCRVEYVG